MIFQVVRSFLFSSALACSGISFAYQTLTCPSVNSIKSEGLTGASEFIYYYVYHNSKYDSQRPWCFVMMHFDTETADEAIQLGNNFLSKLSGNPTPDYTDAAGNAICHYDDIETGTTKLIAYAGTLPCEESRREIFR